MSDLVFYELQKITIKEDPNAFRIATAAILSCGLCGEMIDGMGGPGDGVVCVKCGDELRKRRLVGAVVWDKEQSA
jgi:hypothetical protein